MKKVSASILSTLLALGLLAGCAAPASGAPPASSMPSTSSAAPASQPASVASPDSPWLFTDSAGRDVEIPAGVTRVAPSGAFAQMLILALAPDMLASLASPYSAEAEEFLGAEYTGLPVIGQFYGSQDLNLEEIAAIGPELVIDIGETKGNSAEDMDSITASIAVPAIHIEATLETMGEAFRTLGRVLGREAQAEVLAAYCDDTLAEVRAILDEVGDGKVNLLYCLGDAGLNVIAAGSFHAETIDMVANNLAVVDDPSSKGTGNEVNLEQLLLWNPDWILFGPGSIYDTVADDPTWQQITAIRDGNYCEVPFGPYNWMGFPPSVNRWLGLLWATQLFYPDHAGYDLYEKVAEYYELFYHTTLTQAQFDRLTENSLPQG